MRLVPQINAELCRTCARCQARPVCKTRAIMQIDDGDLPVVESSRCRGCQVCLTACPFGAISVESAARPGM